MASRGGAGDDGGRSSPAAVYDDLVELREHAVTLHAMLQGSPSVSAVDARELMKGMMAKLSSAMSVLGATSGGVAASSGAGRGPGGRRKRSGTASGPHRRSTSRRRSKSPFINMVTARTLNDGKTWRKYGQKYIHASTNPRSYYRCSHKPDQGCQATRQVQESDSNPSEYLISYYGQHTCKDPSTFRSLIIQGAVDAAPPEADCENLISFTSINGAAASTSAFPNRLVKEAVDLHPMLFSRFSNYSSSPPVQEGVSSSSPSHTCKGPSTFRSLIIQGAADAAPPEDFANLISFTTINGAAASTSTGTSAFPNRLVKEAADLHPMLSSRFSNYSSSPPVQEGVSSSSPSPAGHGEFMQYAGGQLVDVIGRRTSPLTVGSAPAEYWPAVGVAGVDMDAGAGMDSFPSSPSSLGFMSGSLGASFGNNNICDDDLFGFDS